MQASEQLSVLKSGATDGELLDVAGLNEITVLIDRSKTELTEVGINVWRSGLEGPPHFHDAKEQLFFILDGTATIFISTDSFRVQPRDLIYIPREAMHRTVVDPGKSLTYLLFNAFSDASKEGHGSFADHIEKVKQTRRRQADDAAVGMDIDWTRSSVKGMLIPAQNVQTASREHPLTVTTLLNKEKSDRCSAHFFNQTANNSQKILTKDGLNVESTIFVVAGSGVFNIDNESWPAGSKDIFFIPKNRKVIAESGSDGLSFLCLNTIL